MHRTPGRIFVSGSVLLLTLALTAASGAYAQSANQSPARGGVGIVQGRVGVERVAVDERTTCVRDRLVGARPQLGIERTPVGAEREPLSAPPVGQESEGTDPCASRSESGSIVQTMTDIVSTVAQGAASALRAVPLLSAIPAL